MRASLDSAFLPEHPWVLPGAFTGLSLDEENTSLEKVAGESAQPVWSSYLVLLNSPKSDFSSAWRAFVSYPFPYSLPPAYISMEPG